MLNQGTVSAAIAVSDMAVAKAFYGGKLGLKQMDENPAGVIYESGGGKMLVYSSPFAGTNKATYAGWQVDDVDAVVSDLRDKGVAFETFELPGATWEGDIAVWGSMKAAWFKDPDGNILSVGNM